MTTLQAEIRNWPTSPGVYLMKDAHGAVLYVGKANNLRVRIANYFQGKDTRYQVAFLMRRVVSLDYSVAGSEKEALFLEYTLIQKYKPRYNIFWKDDKSFVQVRLTEQHPFPGIYTTRKAVKDGARYFGPFVSAMACYETVETIVNHCRLRTCTDREFANRARPCIQYQIGRCTAPCVGKVSEADYAAQLRQATLLLEGKAGVVKKELKRAMAVASQEMRYEDAAGLRDRMNAIAETLESHRKVQVSRLEEDWVRAFMAGHGEDEDRQGHALQALERALHLSQYPYQIECIDISNWDGEQAVGAIVVFQDGKPAKSDYRHYNIQGPHQPNDYAMMYETLSRRYAKHPVPQLLLVDGGKGQLQVALKVIDDLRLPVFPVAAIAKGRGKGPDRIFIPKRKNPLPLKAGNASLLLLQRIRDAAHHFGNSFVRHKMRRARVRVV